ncbi:MAG: hypothetical protein KTV77_02870 [Wolbachia endosymbiont of Fragariocoptes setiger]|nr:hypothetical protein [Wolbachia endosymbiont of Fragariocoptes setiger]
MAHNKNSKNNKQTQEKKTNTTNKEKDSTELNKKEERLNKETPKKEEQVIESKSSNLLDKILNALKSALESIPIIGPVFIAIFGESKNKIRDTTNNTQKPENDQEITEKSVEKKHEKNPKDLNKNQLEEVEKAGKKLKEKVSIDNNSDRSVIHEGPDHTPNTKEGDNKKQI